MEYFYLGDIAKTKAYSDKMLRGRLENKDSVIRNVCMNILGSKREKIQLGVKRLQVNK